MTGNGKNKLKTDPVCQMKVREEEAVTAECDGELYYFCSEGCRDKFLKDRTCERTAYDLIIVGAGPAGLTAGVYAATLKMEALIITKDLGGQAVDSTKIENYMGFDFITGPELIDKFKAQLIHSHYLDHLISEVEKIEQDNGEDLFVHHTEIIGSGFKSLSEGDRVTFDIGAGRKGPAAQNVSKVY